MRRILALVCGLAVLPLIASSAHASTVTVGQLFPPNTCSNGTTLLQTGVSSGASYTFPSSGLVTSWSFQDGSMPVSGLKLKIAQPTATAGTFTILAESSASAQTANFVNTYAVAIPVQAGDLIGIYAGASGQCENSAGTTGADTLGDSPTDHLPGSTGFYPPVTGNRISVSVALQPTPGITLISPASGSLRGGTTVTIAGRDLAGASAVSFGGVAATKFTIGSDNAITATSPPARSRGPVDLHVTTAAGTSPAIPADRFTYAGCVVPNLKGRSLSTARKRLTRAGCKLGKISGPRNGSARVKNERPKAGSVLPDGAKVKVTTG